MKHAVEAHASDYVMPDVMKIGGVTGWLRAAALGEAHGIRLSNHLFIEISTHLLCVTPTAHWLEYAEWFNPIIEQPLRIVDGVRLSFLGDEIEIGIAIGANRAIWAPGRLTLCMKPGVAPGPVLEKALRERAREHFASRLAPLAAVIGVSVPALALSSARTRWGSCSTKSGIRLNWRLIHFPEAIIDYVVVHELAHLRHMNHGPRFWSLVDVGCPDYRAARVELQRLAAHIPHW